MIGNYLDPRLQGRTLNISSLVVLVSVILWGWIWGVVGTLLAVPMTVLIISACERVPALQPIAILLQGGADEASRSRREAAARRARPRPSFGRAPAITAGATRARTAGHAPR